MPGPRGLVASRCSCPPRAQHRLLMVRATTPRVDGVARMAATRLLESIAGGAREVGGAPVAPRGVGERSAAQTNGMGGEQVATGAWVDGSRVGSLSVSDASARRMLRAAGDACGPACLAEIAAVAGMRRHARSGSA